MGMRVISTIIMVLAYASVCLRDSFGSVSCTQQPRCICKFTAPALENNCTSCAVDITNVVINDAVCTFYQGSCIWTAPPACSMLGYLTFYCGGPAQVIYPNFFVPCGGSDEKHIACEGGGTFDLELTCSECQDNF